MTVIDLLCGSPRQRAEPRDLLQQAGRRRTRLSTQRTGLLEPRQAVNLMALNLASRTLGTACPCYH